MRQAAIRGGLVPNTPEGYERVEFVTEGEASFHWCIDKGIATAALKVNLRVRAKIQLSNFHFRKTLPLLWSILAEALLMFPLSSSRRRSHFALES